MKYFILVCTITLAVRVSSHAQNNLIFQGGVEDGFSYANFSQSAATLNNTIFNGGNADGFSSSSYTEVPLVLNNAIFNGGSSDGFAFIIVNNLALPVELLQFEGFVAGNNVHLNWQTATETENDRFEIERSIATSFEKIGSVKGYGTTVQLHNYYWIDQHPLAGRAYYRLKQIDYSSKASYSNVIVIDHTATDSKHFQIFPNPASNGKFTILLTDDISGPIHVHVRNNVGKNIFDATLNDQTHIDVSTMNMNAGTFLIIIKTSSFVDTAKLIIVK